MLLVPSRAKRAAASYLQDPPPPAQLYLFSLRALRFEPSVLFDVAGRLCFLDSERNVDDD